MMIDGVEYLQTTDAAESLGLTVESINKAVQRGNLHPARKIGNYNLFEKTEVERYRTETLGRRGRRRTARKSEMTRAKCG